MKGTQAQTKQQNSNISEFIQIEDIDENNDQLFIKDTLIPYFKDVFQDLSIRSSKSCATSKTRGQPAQLTKKIIDKATFYEYFKLPGIINDRLYQISLQRDLQEVTENSFLGTMIKIFMSSMESRLRLTFNMYDFNQDGYITQEDVKIILSYIPISTLLSNSPVFNQRKISSEVAERIQRTQSDTFTQCVQQQSPQKSIVPNKFFYPQTTDPVKQKPQERINDEQEINELIQKIFKGKDYLSLEEYMNLNQNISSELFCSVMTILHSKMPLSETFFRLKRQFRQQQSDNGSPIAQSPSRKIASPQFLMKQLRLTQKFKSDDQYQQFCTQESHDAQHEIQSTSTFKTQNSGYLPKKANKIQGNHLRFNSSSSISEFTLEKGQDTSEVQAINNKIQQPNHQYEQNYSPFLRFEGAINQQKNDEVYFKMTQSPMDQFNKIYQSKPPINHTDNLNHFQAKDIKEKIKEYQQKRNQKFSEVGSPFKTSTKFDYSKEKIGVSTEQIQLGSAVIADKLPSINSQNNIKKNNQIQAPLTRNPNQTSKRSISISTKTKVKIGTNFKTNQPGLTRNSDILLTPYVIDSFVFNEDLKQKVFQEGICYLKTKQSSLKQHWVVLQGNELYFYKKKNDQKHILMHSLIGTFIKEMIPQDITSTQGKEEEDNQILQIVYPIKILLSLSKSRVLYFQTQKEQEEWSEKLKQVLGNSNIYDFYTIGKTIGQGQYGQVKLANNKETGEIVAIKIIEKKNMMPIEVFQQRKEIEILKMCKHSSIINFIDIFETCDSYFIVLEYMEGSDLFDYLNRRKFKIAERRAKEIAYQIASATLYLHKYGIIHRDLKLENILMNNDSETALPKIVDFGLTKIIGPSEMAEENFGTTGYIAPEILLKKPYTFSCDVWSLGCIIHALLCGFLPFDHKDTNEIIRKTLEDPLNLQLPVWKNISNEAKDLVKKMLLKDPSERISMEQVLTCKWFQSDKMLNK